MLNNTHQGARAVGRHFAPGDRGFRLLRTWTGRTLRVATEVDWTYGRAYYAVDQVGTFTLQRDRFGTIDDRANTLFVHYGRLEGDPFGSPDLPDAPTILGVTLSGACGVNPEALSVPGAERTHVAWQAGRPGGGKVPPKTLKRTHEICTALMSDYLTREDYAAIERARARYLAPIRLREHSARIHVLRQTIATAQAELADELAAADVQAHFAAGHQTGRAGHDD